MSSSEHNPINMFPFKDAVDISTAVSNDVRQAVNLGIQQASRLGITKVSFQTLNYHVWQALAVELLAAGYAIKLYKRRALAEVSWGSGTYLLAYKLIGQSPILEYAKKPIKTKGDI